jgi:hypothetical protein
LCLDVVVNVEKNRHNLTANSHELSLRSAISAGQMPSGNRICREVAHTLISL